MSDRIRYYWGFPQVQTAFDQLLINLEGKKLPPALVSRYAQGQWERICSGETANTPEAIILDKINSVLVDYTFACR